MIKIKGGRAFFNGVTIYSSAGFSSVQYSFLKKKYRIRSGRYIKDSSTKGKLINKIFKIPFIRSFSLIYFLFKNNKKTIFKISILYAFVLFLVLQLSYDSVQKVEVFLENEFLMYILLFVIIGLFIKITPISNYHGAEHMVINYYNEKQDLEFKDLESFQRVSDRCGSVLISIILVIFFGLKIFILNSDLAFLFAYMFGYEIFIGKFWISKPFLIIGRFIQKYILTSVPKKKHLYVAKLALRNAVRGRN